LVAQSTRSGPAPTTKVQSTTLELDAHPGMVPLVLGDIPADGRDEDCPC
jgi:hypothetical protein